MAGLDGIKNKIHPGEAMDKNLYDLPPAELAEVPTVCGSLREALDSLAADHDFLLQGGVFTKDQIEAYIELKWPDVMRWETTPIGCRIRHVLLALIFQTDETGKGVRETGRLFPCAQDDTDCCGQRP
jgi:glutamine synthetase